MLLPLIESFKSNLPVHISFFYIFGRNPFFFEIYTINSSYLSLRLKHKISKIILCTLWVFFQIVIILIFENLQIVTMLNTILYIKKKLFFKCKCSSVNCGSQLGIFGFVDPSCYHGLLSRHVNMGGPHAAWAVDLVKELARPGLIQKSPMGLAGPGLPGPRHGTARPE